MPKAKVPAKPVKKPASRKIVVKKTKVSPKRTKRAPAIDPALPIQVEATPVIDDESWKAPIEAVLRQIPGYDPWAQAVECGAWVDYHAAADAVNWFEDHLKHVEGSSRGVPFTLAPWQAAIVGNLFGWKRLDEKGRVVRRYRKTLIYVPRGNGKTPLVSGIVMYAFYTDDEPGAQCYLAAGARDQAGILFRNAKGMVEQNEELLQQVRIYAGDQHRSLVMRTDSLRTCKVIPADAAGQHGGIPHITAVDEVHVQENRDLMDVFETAMAKQVRKQPMLVMITTADYDRVSICNEMYDHACRVRDNGGDPAKPGLDPTFLPVIYEIPQDGDWEDEALWAKANPNLGISVSLTSLREAYRKGKENPAFENVFRRLHLNQRTKQNMRLVSMEAWRACKLPLLVETLKGKKCFAGIDLASTEDLAAIALVFPLPEEQWAVVVRVFCPEEKIKRRSKMKVPYDIWQRDGHIIGTAGDQIDYNAIRDEFDKLKETYDIVEVGIDPAGATQFMQDLQATYGEEFVISIPQTHQHIADATKEVVRRVKLGKVIHGGNPVLDWAVGNVAGVFKGRLPTAAELTDFLDKVPVIPSKRHSADKIDPFAALVDAVARLLMRPQNEGQSVYETRGVRTL